MINKPLNAIKAVEKFAAKRDVRYYLQGIALYIKDNHIMGVCATNGHVLALVGDYKDCDHTAIIDNNDIKSLCNALASGGEIVVNKSNITIGNYSIPEIGGRYPEIGRVIPSIDRVQGQCIGVNPDYLALLKNFKTGLYSHLPAKERNKIGCKIFTGDATDPLLFKFDQGDDKGLVVIMPMRV